MPRHKRRAWPALAKLDAKRLSSRLETPEIIRKLLQPKEEFDQIEDSCSDISDKFEEFHRNSFYNVKKSGRKNISKYDADLLTMAEFTEDFKNTMGITKDELQIGGDMANENLNTVDKVIKAPKEEKALPETLKDEINKLLSEPDKISMEIDSVTAASKKPDEDLSYDYMSGIWSMIDAHCKDTKFTISPINFDVYNQSQPHWLERPEISQKVIDNSKVKCQKWLTEYHKQ